MTQGTVLVVEDDVGVAGFIEAALTEDGYRVEVTQGEGALELAPTLNPDVILLDMMMPGMDGGEVSRRLRASPQTAYIPIVLMSAQLDRCPPDLPVDAWLSKPFSLVSLCHMVDGYME
jgi:CheY-like chemotaxis protein